MGYDDIHVQHNSLGWRMLVPCFKSGDEQRIVDDPHKSLQQKIKENVGVSTYTARRCIDFTTRDIVIMGSSDTTNTRLRAQTLTETLKKNDQ